MRINIINKKKILLIITSLDRCGTENVCINLFQEFLNKKYDITLLVLNKKRKNFFYKEIDKKQRERIIFSENYNWFSIFIDLKELTKKNKFNTIISFNNETALFVIIIRLFLKRNYKVILRVNNSLKNKIKYSKNFLVAYKKKIYYFISLFLSDKIVVQSKEMYSEIQRFNISKRKIQIIYNPISKIFKKVPVLKTKKSYFLFVGSLTFKKNPLLLLEIYKKFKSLNIKNIKLKIIGKGDQYCRLKNFIINNNLSKDIELINEINQYKLKNIYTNAFCLIISSRYEGFPNVAIESLNSGTPILAYKGIGGIKELIKPNINGIIVDCYTIASYVKGLKKILKTKFNRNKIKDTAKKFNIDNIIQDYEEII